MVLSLFKCSILPLLIHIHTDLSNTIGRFKTSQYHPTSVRISWKAVKAADNDVITAYRVQVVGPDAIQVIPITCKYITSVEISDLRPSAQYTFKVGAMIVRGTTGETPMPYNIIMCIWHHHLVL